MYNMNIGRNEWFRLNVCPESDVVSNTLSTYATVEFMKGVRGTQFKNVGVPLLSYDAI